MRVLWKFLASDEALLPATALGPSIEALESLLLEAFDLTVARGPTSIAQLSPPSKPSTASSMQTPDLMTIKEFFDMAPTLLVLDNFESVYDGTSSQLAVVQFLEELATACSLILTMRGGLSLALNCASRVLDLEGLSEASAKRAFLNFGGMQDEEARREAEQDPALDALLKRLDGHALSIALLGRQAEAGYSFTELLQLYHDLTSDVVASPGSHSRLASLSASITVSLNMPVLRETQGARELCCLMARLPDGADSQTIETILFSGAVVTPSPGAGQSAGLANGESAVLAARARSACFTAGLIVRSDNQGRWRMLTPVQEFIIKAAAAADSPLNGAALSLADIDLRIFDFYSDRLAQIEALPLEEWQNLPFSMHRDLRNVDQTILRALSPPGPRQLLEMLGSLCHYLIFTAPSYVECAPTALKRTNTGKRLLEDASCSSGHGTRLRRLLNDAGFSSGRGIYSRRKADCLLRLGRLALQQGRVSEGRQALGEAGDLYKKIGSKLGKANVLQYLGDLAREEGHRDEARRLLEEAGGLYDKVRDKLGKANNLQTLGDLVIEQGRYDEGEQLLETARSLYDRVGGELNKAQISRSLGDLAAKRGQFREGQRLLEEARGLYSKVGNSLGKAFTLRSLGDLAVQQGRLDEGKRLLQEAQGLFDKLGNSLGKANTLRGLGDLAVRQGRLDEGQCLLQEAHGLFDKVGNNSGKADTLRSLGDLEVQRGRPDEGQRLLEEACGLYDKTGPRLGEANALLSLANLAIQQGRRVEGGQLLMEACHLFDEEENREGVVKCMKALGDLAVQQTRQGIGYLWNHPGNILRS